MAAKKGRRRELKVRKGSTARIKRPTDEGKEIQINVGPGQSQGSYRVSVGGSEKVYDIKSGYGYFIRPFRKATNLAEVAVFVDRGLPSKEIESVIEYLDFKVGEIAKAAAVSPSTVSRWTAESSIGTPGSSQFFKIDEVIRKGVTLFGGEDEFKNWLIAPNKALSNAIPARLITSQIGIDMVDEALDALSFGSVM